ncbi:MAG: hypothetical protein JW951_10170 [Lentisphaerae bacterium]|nr:hypothetical protein [Lentisphaerota bacterium]
MKRRLHIMLLADGACIPDDDPELLGEGTADSTEFHVAHALRELGHTVTIHGVAREVGTVVRAVNGERPDLVFNLTEEFRGNRQFDRNIAALLELLHVPFTGSGSVGLMLTRGKGLCKQLLTLHRIRVPGFLICPPGRRTRAPKSLRYPLVVKPAYEDGSDGISMASLVKDEAGLRERVRMVHERWKQPAVAEEYVEGRELYVSVLGNRRLQVLPPRGIVFGGEGNGGPLMATGRVKWDEAYRKHWKVSFGFAELDEAEHRRLARVCKRAFRVLELRDYARFDVRLTPEGRIVVLEANANPDLAYGDELAESAERAGIGYEALVARIVRLALRRYKG